MPPARKREAPGESVSVQLPFLRLGSKSKVLGLDIGSSCVKAIEVAPRGDGFELLHLGVASLPHDAIVEGAFLNASAIADAIREAVAKSGSKAKHAAAAVSGHSVIVKKITVPAMTPAELEESIRWEAEQYIPFDVNEVNLDFEILQSGDAERPMEVLLVAAKRDMIDDYVNLIGEAGLQPAVIDVAGFAVENAYESNYGASQEVVALVNIGAQTSTINVVAGGVPAFTRDISTGGNQYTAEIQRALSVGFDEAERIKIGEPRARESQDVVPQEVEQAMRAVTNNLVGEIARSLDFFAATAADARIQRVYLAGGSSRVSGLEAAFRERTGLEVELLNPLARMLPSNRFEPELLDQVGPSLGVGVGLALRRVDE
jgi:type IV pilus assembly protein PilM